MAAQENRQTENLSGDCQSKSVYTWQ